jgi:hypothetical protein
MPYSSANDFPAQQLTQKLPIISGYPSLWHRKHANGFYPPVCKFQMYTANIDALDTVTQHMTIKHAELNA